MSFLSIQSSVPAHRNALRYSLIVSFALVFLGTSCKNDDVEVLFDEAGVWSLTKFNLRPKPQDENPNDSSTGGGEFKDLNQDANNAFLLNFAKSKKIVTAASCARGKGESHQLSDSLCYLNDDAKTRDWRCSCFSYTYEGDSMEWTYLGGDEDDFARQHLAETLAPVGVELAFPDDQARSDDESSSEEEDGDSEDSESEESENDDSKDDSEAESESESGGESDGRYKTTIVTLKKDPERNSTYHFSPLPGASDEEQDGLFQSNGENSIYVFQHRADKFFEESGCAKACEKM